MDQTQPKDKNNNAGIVIVGRYFCDLVFTRLPELPRLGHEVYAGGFDLVPGGVATPAIALSRLGLNVIWPCEFGSDPFSQFVKDEVLSAGVDGSYFTDSPYPSLRITVAFSFQDERAFLSYTDPLPVLPNACVIRETRPKWVYITHLMVGGDQELIVDAAREVGARVFMDCQAHALSLDDTPTREALGRVDVFSPNAAEALSLTGELGIEHALKKLSALTPLVIIKDGLHGCLAGNAQGIMQSEAVEVDVKDTTGAGDNFNCGFLYGQMKGFSLEKSLRIANICGSLSTRGLGGSAASPTPDEIQEYLDIS